LDVVGVLVFEEKEKRVLVLFLGNQFFRKNISNEKKKKRLLSEREPAIS